MPDLNTIISSEMLSTMIHEVIAKGSRLYDRLDSKHLSSSRKGRQEYLRLITSGLQQHVGLLAGTMNHDLAYNFLNLGRKLERADMTSRIINAVTIKPLPEKAMEWLPFTDTIWMSILESLGGYQMYRQTMQPRISRSLVLTFLFRRGRSFHAP